MVNGRKYLLVLKNQPKERAARARHFNSWVTSIHSALGPIAGGDGVGSPGA